ncbi:hypothetical protein Dip518_000949 [Parelusimicrobium proximum]|uniref:hypothetical protein n=1 Tax=Parelusimicrobium proximum TaxID=3228953 RepID=UPI003D166B41
MDSLINKILFGGAVVVFIIVIVRKIIISHRIKSAYNILFGSFLKHVSFPEGWTLEPKHPSYICRRSPDGHARFYIDKVNPADFMIDPESKLELDAAVKYASAVSEQNRWKDFFIEAVPLNGKTVLIQTGTAPLKDGSEKKIITRTYLTKKGAFLAAAFFSSEAEEQYTSAWEDFYKPIDEMEIN